MPLSGETEKHSGDCQEIEDPAAILESKHGHALWMGGMGL